MTPPVSFHRDPCGPCYQYNWRQLAVKGSVFGMDFVLVGATVTATHAFELRRRRAQKGTGRKE